MNDDFGPPFRRSRSLCGWTCDLALLFCMLFLQFFEIFAFFVRISNFHSTYQHMTKSSTISEKNFKKHAKRYFKKNQNTRWFQTNYYAIIISNLPNLDYSRAPGYYFCYTAFLFCCLFVWLSSWNNRLWNFVSSCCFQQTNKQTTAVVALGAAWKQIVLSAKRKTAAVAASASAAQWPTTHVIIWWVVGDYYSVIIPQQGIVKSPLREFYERNMKLSILCV